MPHHPRKVPRAHHKKLLPIALLAALFLLPLTPVEAQTPIQTLNQLLQNPPDDAKPMVRWWWFGPAVEKPEILRELQQMKADGIGGVELAFVYPEAVDSATIKNLPFLSPEMLEAVTYANTEARKLNLRVDVTLCSGWPYGGPHIPLEQAATRLRIAEVPIPSNTNNIAPPHLAEGKSFLSAAIVTGTLTPPPIRPAPAPTITWNPTAAQPLTLPTPATITPSANPRIAVFFIQSHTLQQVKRAAVGAEGYVLDPFSREAVANHLKSVGEPLLKAFGPNPPDAIFSDSLEAYGADWTPTLPAEFKKRRGYDLLPHLPELVAGSQPSKTGAPSLAASSPRVGSIPLNPTPEQIRHDYGETLTELVNEDYITQINNWATAHHTKFRSQTYGEPAVSFSSQNLAALPEGEGPQWRAFSTLRWATSANHVFGNNVTSGETFTWLHSPVFRATPLDMKAEADIDFIMGENQLIFHGWPYSPPASELPRGDPGWSLYAAAALNDHNPWHPVMPAVTQYITRISALLRQGQPANQVAILLPTDDAWASFSPGKVTVSGAMQRLLPPGLIPAVLSAGYNFDFIDADAIDKGGLGTHSVVVLPETKYIPAATVQRLLTFSSKGGKLLFIGKLPDRYVDGKPASLVWNGPHSPLPPVIVPDPSHLGRALVDAIPPDLAIAKSSVNVADQLGYIRRKLPDADIYFVVNTGNTSIDTTATFSSSHKRGVATDPDTTVSTAASAINQSIQLAPYESRIFLFSDAPPSPKPAPNPALAPHRDAAQLFDISTGWTATFASTGKSLATKLPSDWSAIDNAYSGEVVYKQDVVLPKLPPGPCVLQVLGGKALPGAPNSTPDQPTLDPNGLPNPLVTRTGPGMHAFYDPPIREAALVTINGQPAGALWHPPYTLEVSKLLESGPNHIEIHVFNTALNAWAAIPPRDYKPLIAKYGDRFQMQDLNQVQPLPSGILGTIHLVTQPYR